MSRFLSMFACLVAATCAGAGGYGVEANGVDAPDTVVAGDGAWCC
jgi:hypothetical protein